MFEAGNREGCASAKTLQDNCPTPANAGSAGGTAGQTHGIPPISNVVRGPLVLIIIRILTMPLFYWGQLQSKDKIWALEKVTVQ